MNKINYVIGDATAPEAEGRVTAGLLQVPLFQLLRPQPVNITLASAIGRHS